MKDDPPAKDLYKHGEQRIPVKYFSRWYDRKIYQGWPERNEDPAKPENKAYQVKHFRRRYLTYIIQCLPEMQRQRLYIILRSPAGIIYRVLIHDRNAMNGRRKLHNKKDP